MRLTLCQHKDDNQDDRGNCTFYARGFCKNGPRCSRNHNTQARPALLPTLNHSLKSASLALTLTRSRYCAPTISLASARGVQVRV